MTTIYIDGDACPVKSEAISVAERHTLPVFLVSNSGMRTGNHPLVKNIMVSDGADAADDWIAEEISAGDIAITADIPLADRCLKKDAHVIGPDGRAFTHQNIGSALAARELNRHLRETGVMTGGNAQFSKTDRSRFMNALDQLIRKTG
ncbi:YaiI/YqxD family protein [Pyruvatibacter mobilis]|uniref:YaiI/YqxD family protein n=1 Tax=Pyruvatibacter mobilis TaxID=1712261 RepID=UPI0004208714